MKEGGREGGRRKGRRGRDIASCQQLIYSYSLNWFLSKLHVEGVESLVLLPRRNVTSSMQSC